VNFYLYIYHTLDPSHTWRVYTYIYTFSVVDLPIKWHNDSQDDLFKDLFSAFLMFVCLCLYFLSWRSFSVRSVCIFVKRDWPDLSRKTGFMQLLQSLPANNLTTLMFAAGFVCVSLLCAPHYVDIRHSWYSAPSLRASLLSQWIYCATVLTFLLTRAHIHTLLSF